eukprot:1089388-Prorocentrum_minimum.AAC.1
MVRMLLVFVPQVGLALRRALCSGWGDRIARRMRASEMRAEFTGQRRKAVRYKACTVDPDDPHEVGLNSPGTGLSSPGTGLSSLASAARQCATRRAQWTPTTRTRYGFTYERGVQGANRSAGMGIYPTRQPITLLE